MPTPTIQAHLSQDEKLAPLVQSIELPVPGASGDIYADLIRAIVYQQLSGKAAATIHGRFLQLFNSGYPHPEELILLDIPRLRGVGLSNQKASYVQNVARHFVEHRLIDKVWDDHPDEEVIRLLTSIKGVGRWTVEMILMFSLERPDVLPLDDLGIQQAMQRLYQIDATGRPLRARMTEIAEAWRPYRTYACRYLWRWKDAK